MDAINRLAAAHEKLRRVALPLDVFNKLMAKVQQKRDEATREHRIAMAILRVVGTPALRQQRIEGYEAEMVLWDDAEDELRAARDRAAA